MPAADDITYDSEDDETLQFNTEAEANARAAVVVSAHRRGYRFFETPRKCTVWKRRSALPLFVLKVVPDILKLMHDDTS